MKVVDSLSCLKHATAARLRFCPDDCTSRVQSSKSGMRATPLLLSTKERDERASLHSSRVTPESATTSSSGRKVCCKTLCAALGRRLTCGRAEMMTAQAARSGASVFSVSAIWTSLTNGNPCTDSVGDTKTEIFSSLYNKTEASRSCMRPCDVPASGVTGYLPTLASRHAQ